MKMLSVIKLQLKVSFGLSALKWNMMNDKKKFFGSIALAAVIAVSVAPLLYLYVRLIQEMYDASLLLGQPELVLASAIIISAVLVLVFSLPYVMSVFYFSRDLSLLLPLPLRPRDILGAKFTVVLFFEYLTIALFFLPALVVYGYNSSAGLLYWLTGLAVFVLLPLIPLALSSMFILLLMRVTNLSRKRDTLRLIGLFAFLALVLLFNYFVAGIPAGEEAQFIERILLEEEGLLNFATRTYPPALFAARALTAGGTTALINFAYFLGMSLAGLSLVFFLGQQLFYQGLIGGSEVEKGNGISQEVLARKTAGSSSPAWAIAMREIKYLIRTPIFLFNSLAMVAIMPLALAVPLLASGSLSETLLLLQEQLPRVIQIFGAGGIIGVMAIFAPAASSSFSREGKLFKISQVIPVSPREQINGKVLYAMLLSIVTVPIVAVFALLFLSVTLPELLIIIVTGLILSLPAVTSSLLIDLLRPYLLWDNPQKPIKQNINVLLGMVVGGGIYYLLFLAGRAAYQASYADTAIYLIVLSGSALLGFLFYWILLKIAPARYRDIEV